MQYGGCLAQKFQSRVMILNVAEGMNALDKVTYRQYKDEILESIEKQIANMPSLVNCVTEAKVDWLDLKNALYRSIDDFQIDLVVMGTKGVHGLFKELAGSNTYDIIKGCKVPVVVVPANYEYKEPKKIGFASDFRQIDHLLSLDALLDMVYAFNAELHVFHVLVQGEKELDEEYFNMKELDDYFSGVKHKFYEIKGNDTWAGIEDFVKSNQIDMLGITPRKHSLFSELGHSPTTKTVTHHTKLPILTLPEL